MEIKTFKGKQYILLKDYFNLNRIAYRLLVQNLDLELRLKGLKMVRGEIIKVKRIGGKDGRIKKNYR